MVNVLKLEQCMIICITRDLTCIICAYEASSRWVNIVNVLKLEQCTGDKNISVLHLSCRASDL